MLTVTRVVYPALGIAMWQRGYENINEKVDVIYAENLKLPVTIVAIALIFVGVLLDVLVWRKRKFARYLIYYELLSAIVQGLIPLNFGDFESLTAVMIITNTFFYVGCDPRSNIILCTVTQLFIEFVLFPKMYQQEWAASMIIRKLLYTVITFLFLVCVGVLVVHITQIKTKLARLLRENLNLFDKMHEGLIVLDQKDKSVKFASVPAVHHLKQQELTDGTPITSNLNELDF